MLGVKSRCSGHGGNVDPDRCPPALGLGHDGSLLHVSVDLPQDKVKRP